MLPYIILLGIFIFMVFCYAIFKAVHILELSLEEKNENLSSNLKELVEEKSTRLSNQLFEINHRIDFYLNNTSLVEKFGFDDALKNYLETKFKEDGYSTEQAKFKALLVTEEMQFDTIVLDFLLKEKKHSHLDMEREFEILLGGVEFQKEFLHESELQENAYCLIKQITQDKERFNKKGMVLFKTSPPIDILGGTYHNHYYLFLEKFFLLDYLIKHSLIQKIDYKEEETLGIYCDPSEYCFKINDTEVAKFLDKNKQIETYLNIDWFSYSPV